MRIGLYLRIEALSDPGINLCTQQEGVRRAIQPCEEEDYHAERTVETINCGELGEVEVEKQ